MDISETGRIDRIRTVRDPGHSGLCNRRCAPVGLHARCHQWHTSAIKDGHSDLLRQASAPPARRGSRGNGGPSYNQQLPTEAMSDALPR